MADLADKVRFWEEQQEINDLLIPRVVDGAKALEALSGRLAQVSEKLIAHQISLDAAEDRIAALEAAQDRAMTVAGLALAVAVVTTVGAALWASGVAG